MANLEKGSNVNKEAKDKLARKEDPNPKRTTILQQMLKDGKELLRDSYKKSAILAGFGALSVGAIAQDSGPKTESVAKAYNKTEVGVKNTYAVPDVDGKTVHILEVKKKKANKAIIKEKGEMEYLGSDKPAGDEVKGGNTVSSNKGVDNQEVRPAAQDPNTQGMVEYHGAQNPKAAGAVFMNGKWYIKEGGNVEQGPGPMNPNMDGMVEYHGAQNPKAAGAVFMNGKWYIRSGNGEKPSSAGNIKEGGSSIFIDGAEYLEYPYKEGGSLITPYIPNTKNLRPDFKEKDGKIYRIK